MSSVTPCRSACSHGILFQFTDFRYRTTLLHIACPRSILMVFRVVSYIGCKKIYSPSLPAIDSDQYGAQVLNYYNLLKWSNVNHSISSDANVPIYLILLYACRFRSAFTRTERSNTSVPAADIRPGGRERHTSPSWRLTF